MFYTDGEKIFKPPPPVVSLETFSLPRPMPRSPEFCGHQISFKGSGKQILDP